jgi:hypothetical protein
MRLKPGAISRLLPVHGCGYSTAFSQVNNHSKLVFKNQLIISVPQCLHTDRLRLIAPVISGYTRQWTQPTRMHVTINKLFMNLSLCKGGRDMYVFKQGQL